MKGIKLVKREDQRRTARENKSGMVTRKRIFLRLELAIRLNGQRRLKRNDLVRKY